MTTSHNPQDLLAAAAHLRTLLVRDRWNDSSTRKLRRSVREMTKAYAEAAGISLPEAAAQVQAKSDSER